LFGEIAMDFTPQFISKTVNLVSCFLNKHIIIDNGDFTVQGILLGFKPSRKHPIHEPFTLILLTKNGKTIVRNWQIIKVK
jgi:hypothetical protein